MTRYVPYWCCYLHQGMLTALMLQGVAGYFRHTGLDLAQLSWLPLTMLPWVAKCLWAPWGERHALPLAGNRYLGSLVLLQLCMATLLAAIGWLPPAQSVGTIMIALMLLACLSASHDIYADGITICTTDARTRPLANAAQVGGSYLGIVFGSFVFLALAERAGWRGGFVGIAAVSLMLLVPIGLLARPTAPMPCHAPARLDSRGLVALRQALALTAVYYLAMRGLMALQTVVLVDQGLSLAALGTAVTVYSTVASGLGIAFGSRLARRIGALRCLLPVMFSHAAIAALIALAYPRFGLVAWLALYGLVNAAAAIGFVTLYNVLMGLVRAHQPASDYALFQSADAAISMLVSIAALRFAHHAGYRTTFVVLAIVAIASVVPARRLCRRLEEHTRESAFLQPPPATHPSEVIHG